MPPAGSLRWVICPSSAHCSATRRVRRSSTSCFTRALIDEAGGASEVAAAVPTEAVPGFAAASEGTVTLMFSDVEGFTEMTERLGDHRAHEVMRDHNAIVREQLKALGGQELELQG